MRRRSAASGNNTSDELDPQNPFLITTGSHLILRSDNTGGFDGNVSIDIRGPQQLSTANATFDGYITFTIQAGATVQQTGPGALRFGRIGSQGIAIIGQGNSSSGDSVLQLGPDFWMTDGNTTTRQ